MSSQKRKRSDFADGASTSGSTGNDFEVFLSFRGPDTRNTVADLLYVALVRAGIRVYRDEEELRVGETMGQELLRAIDNSRIYVPIFSDDYASSHWCLRELARIVKCQKENAERQIMPFFYGVSPSDVRHCEGSYGEALRKHEGRYGEETVREWREALREVADRKGWDARNARLGKLIEDIVREFSIKLKKRQKVLPDHLVGIDDRVKDVVQWLDCSSLDVRFLAVHGLGGIGKTTLAKAVFNEIAPLFDHCSFVSDVRESSLTGDIVRLQNQLLFDILKSSTDVHDVDDGVNIIQERFRHKRVLIVLDDVDNREQLMELMGNGDWLGLGSRIIVTTRNVDLLATEVMGVNVPFLPKQYYAYEMKELNPCHALQLFSKHAFGETFPPDDREVLSSEIVANLGGLPLALDVIGSCLHGKRLELWEEILERLSEGSDRNVQGNLKIRYETLSFEERQIFLDTACFFNGIESTSAKYVWKDCGFSPESGLTSLSEMGLLKIDRHNILRMHDLIRDLGREIVRKEKYLNAQGRSRLWEPEECLRILREPIGSQRTGNIELLRLQFPKVQTLTSQVFGALPNLRCLHVEGANFVGDYKNVFAELRWLSWDRCPADFDATNFSPTNLVALTLSGSELRVDWPGWHQILKSSKLKSLELGKCRRLTRLPNLSGLLTLERLIIRNCERLVEIDESIGKLVRLKELIVRGTILGPVGLFLPHSIGDLQSLTRLELEIVGISALPLSIGELKNLASLRLSRCCELRKLPDSIGRLESLLMLDLSYTKVTELPDSIGNLKKLKVIKIDHSQISKIPGTIGMVEKLEEFHAEKCENLEGDIPSGIGSLSFLKILNLSHTRIKSVPTTINQLSHLKELHLEGCHELKRIPELPSSLINLDVVSCSLETIPNLSNLTNLVNLIVSDYFEESLSNPWDADPIQIPNLEWVGRLSRLEKLKLVHKRIIVPPTGLASLPGLEQLVLSCYDLQSLPQPLPPTLSLLKLINFKSLPEVSPRSDLKYLPSLELCKSWLTDISLSRFGLLESLTELTVSNCESLERLSCMSSLKKLRVLRLVNCPMLVEIKGLEESELLESIRIDQCSFLVRLPPLLKLKKLRTIEFLSCRSLVSLPYLPRVAFDCHLVVDGCDELANHNGPFQLHKVKRQCPNPIRTYEPEDRDQLPCPVCI